MLHLAIKKINPDAEFTINGDDIDQITWMNGTTPISKEDIEAMLPTVEAEEAQKILDKETANESAVNKLKALGLTDEEIEAFRGN
jgi:hypothetical protein|tara:strand:- start:283 stop:537 length:255 start_codon:yes stop_codon:yes gene_type:complete